MARVVSVFRPWYHCLALEQTRNSHTVSGDSYMRALVVYELMYCNTHHVARAVADGLASSIGDVEVAEVCQSPRRVSADVNLLVVGGPIRAFAHLSAEPAPHELDAVRPMTGSSLNLREWLDLVDIAAPLYAAAFIAGPTSRSRNWGIDAERAHHRLARLGAALVTPLANYDVVGKQDTLLDQQLERARAWGEHLAHAVHQPVQLSRQAS